MEKLQENEEELLLKKALAFLMSKEMQEYSLEKRLEFLKGKMPFQVLNQAKDIYFIIEKKFKELEKEILTNQKTNTDDSSNYNKLFSNIGKYSSIFLTVSIITYMFNVNRSKKDEIENKEQVSQLETSLKENFYDVNREQSYPFYSLAKLEALKDFIQRELRYNYEKYNKKDDKMIELKEKLIELKRRQNTQLKMIKDLPQVMDQKIFYLNQNLVKKMKELIEESNKKLYEEILKTKVETMEKIRKKYNLPI
jgi:hypothetical protein